MIRKTLSFLISCTLLFSLSSAAAAAEIENAAVSAPLETAVVAADYPEVGSELEPAAALPSSFSSAEIGYTTPVRNQSYNTCWAYSSTATLESLLLKQFQPARHLSTMHMNYWGCTRDDGTGWQRVYSAAGYPYIALGYLTSFGCVINEKFDESKSGEDFALMGGSLYPYRSADAIIYLDADDRDTIKTAIWQYGGVVGNLHYLPAFLSADNRSYYCDSENLATSQLNGHAVELVGWDDNYSASNFNSDHIPSSDGAWLCKNSWGESYGDNGYFWISYEDHYLFESRFGPSYAIAGNNTMTAVSKIQQAEIYGATYEFDYAEQMKPNLSKITYANVLDFSDGYHNIDKVIFESTSEGSSYTVWYIPLDSDGLPETSVSSWTMLAQGTIGYQGYISAEVGGFDAPQEKAAIGVQIEKADKDGHIAIGVNEWLSAGGKMLIVPESQKGQSYLLGYRAAAMDVMDFYRSALQDDVGGTFVIKALCRSDEKEGDADRDGEFTILDVTASQRVLAEMAAFSDEQQRFADYDNNGEFDIIDCTKMQRSLAHMTV